MLQRATLAAATAHQPALVVRRRAVLRAAVAEPALLLADEPTSALDMIAAAGLLALLTELTAAGVAAGLVSHDEALLAAVAGRILRLQDGQLVPASPSMPDGASRRSGVVARRLSQRPRQAPQ